MQRDLYYRHSGEFPITAAPFGLLIGSFAGCLLGIAYAYAIIYCPLVYVNGLVGFAFGFAVGWITAKALAWLNVRNCSLMYGVTFLSVAISFYAAWVVWVAGVLHRGGVDVPLLPLMRHPRVVWTLVKAINEHGTWSLGRGNAAPATGLFLWLVWFLEATLIFWAAWVAASRSLAVPFCEACKKWCGTQPVRETVNPCEGQLLRERLEAGDFSFLQQLGAAPEGASAYCVFEVYGCPECDQMNTLSVKSVTVAHNKKGERKEQKKTILDRLLLDIEQMRAFTAACEAVSGTAEAEPTTATSADSAAEPAGDSLPRA